MQRTRGAKGNGIGLVGVGWAFLVLLSAFWGGCGKQDLYKPPQSSYSVVGRLVLPSSPEGLSILGNTAFVAGGETGLFAVDLTDPASPHVVGTADTPKYSNGVAAVSTQDAGRRIDFAFVADGTEGIDIFDVTRPDSIIMYPYFDTYDARAMTVALPQNPSEPYSVYLADSWRGCWRLDSVVGTPGSIFMAGRSYTIGSAEGIATADNFAYVADDERGLVVVDATIPVAMQVVSNCDTDGTALAVAVNNGHAYVADGKDGLVVMSIHLGDTPVIVGRLPLPGTCRGIAVRDNVAFIAAQDGGTHIVDVSNPASPKLAGTVLSTYATGVALGNSGAAVICDRNEGLIVLGSRGAFSDLTPPASIADLTAEPRSQTSISLSWHSPGNDMYNGCASLYDIRYSTLPITAANWDSATACENEPAPSPSGSQESYRVSGLQPVSEYHFAVRTADAAGNWSGLSNVVSAATFADNVPPTLTNESFDPPGAETDTLPSFTFQVTYTDADGDAPGRAEVIVGEEAHTMTQAEGTSFEDGVVYRVSGVHLTNGSYQHYFSFDDGHDHAVQTSPAPGPWVAKTIYFMGSPVNELGRDTDETEHLVPIDWDWWISDHEVTQGEWQTLRMQYPALLRDNPSHFTGSDSLPVENVDFFDAVAFCNARSMSEGLTPCYTVLGDSVAWSQEADGYRLPTEAEWEIAARGESTTRTAFATGNLTIETCRSANQPDPVLDQIGWYCGNALDHRTHKIMTKQPITWKGQQLWDMNGNVWEWCWDWYSVNGATGSATGPGRGSQRVIRGGSWYYYARDCRAAARAPYWPNSKDDIVGFRVARTIVR